MQIEEDWKAHLKGIRANINPLKDSGYELRCPLPSAAQKSFFDALGLLWLLELRTCFQNADKEENIHKYSSPTPQSGNSK